MIVLKSKQVDSLCFYVEKQLKKAGCDHSLRHTFEWAAQNKIDQANLIDILEANGGFCDCEVTMNLPEDCNLELEIESIEMDLNNPFKLPSNFQISEDKIYNKAVFSSKEYGHNNYTQDNELLIPAPYGFKPKKRVRKSVHFFNGLETELPTEVGFVKEIEPTNAKDFAKRVRDSKKRSLAKFSVKDADYYLSKVEKVDVGKPMATHFMEKTGLGGTKVELRIHKIFLRK